MVDIYLLAKAISESEHGHFSTDNDYYLTILSPLVMSRKIYLVAYFAIVPLLYRLEKRFSVSV